MILSFNILSYLVVREQVWFWQKMVDIMPDDDEDEDDEEEDGFESIIDSV